MSLRTLESVYFSSCFFFARRNWRCLAPSVFRSRNEQEQNRGDKIGTFPNKSAFLLGTQAVSAIKFQKLQSTKNNREGSLLQKNEHQIVWNCPLKAYVRFWYNNRLLASYSCQELFMRKEAVAGWNNLKKLKRKLLTRTAPSMSPCPNPRPCKGSPPVSLLSESASCLLSFIMIIREHWR